MNLQDIKQRLEMAADSLFRNQPNICDFTSETSQTEWNLSHHFANEIHELLPDLDCDLDIIKPNFGNRRPDIILHKRGTHKSNVLVVEVKKDVSVSVLEKDLQKIISHWFRNPLNFRFGAAVNLMLGKTSIVKVIENTGGTGN